MKSKIPTRKEIEKHVQEKRQWGHERVRMVPRTQRGQKLALINMMKQYPTRFKKNELRAAGLDYLT
jgi:hypothetical protein